MSRFMDKLSEHAVLVPAPEFVLIPVEEGYILDGGRQAEMLSGPFALSTLPVILPLVDGSRSFFEITTVAPQVAPREIEEAVRQLLGWGVLAVREREAALPQEIRNTLSYLKRGNSGINLEAAASVLADTQIVLVHDEPSCELGEEAAEALKENGFSHVRVQHYSGTASPVADRDSFVVSLVSEASSPAATREYYAWVRNTGCRWLRASLGEASAEIGPVFTADTNLCLPCLVEKQSENDLTCPSLCRTDRVALSAMLASEVTALLLNPSPASRTFRRYSLAFFQPEVRTWPTNGLCLQGHGEHVDRQEGAVLDAERIQRIAPLSMLYEEAIASRQETSDIGGDTQAGLPSSHKKMLNSPSITLPTMKLDLPQPILSLLLAKQKSRETSLQLEAVAQLLALSVGVKTMIGNEVRRWAPSGGNLGSAEAYLIATNVEGLAPGIYLYKPEEHTLKRLNQQNTGQVRVACKAVLEGQSAPAMIVFVGAYCRIGRKYGSFAYKLAHLDAGSASSQLLLTASALRLDVRNAQRWMPKKLASALLLRDHEEAVTQVFCLGSWRSAVTTAGSPHKNTKLRSFHKTSEPLNFCDLSPKALVKALADCDNYVEGRLPSCIGPSKPLSLDHLHVSLLTRARSQITLGAALNKRSSRRAFSGSGIELADINLLLRTALDNNIFAGSRLSVSVLVQRSVTCEPGIYRFEPWAKRLARQRHTFSRKQIEQLFFAEDYGDTPLIFWISGLFFPMVETGWKRGEYQTLLLRAGLLGHRLWMAALGLGLEGALIAGIRSGTANRSERFMEDGEVSLLAFLCGYPKQTEASQAQSV